MNYTDFVNKFRVKHVRVVRDRDYNTIHYGSYNKTASYYADREEIIEMEIPRSGFEELVYTDREYNLHMQTRRDEVRLRREYPALQQAYEKYLMLLELYK